MSGMFQMTLWWMLGVYKIPNVEVHVEVYATNKMPIGPVRGAGRPEGTYFIERAMNIMAEKMEIDPLELRLRNLPVGEMPRGARPRSSGKADLSLLIKDLIKHARYEELQEWKRGINSEFGKRGPSHSPIVAGIGVSVHGEGSDTDWDNSDEDSGGEGKGWTSEGKDEEPGDEERPASLDFLSETARVALERSGRVTVYTGSSPHGQGEETTFAQLASEELQVPLEEVTVVWGDSVLVPDGVGTFGSRSAVTGGSSVVDASRKLRARLLTGVSTVTGREVKSIAISGGRLIDPSGPGADLPTTAELLDSLGVAELSARSVFKVGSMTDSSGAHLCAVTLDVELGKVKIVKYVVVEDCGRMINRQIVEGQLHGGVLHAIGGTLFEKLAFDDQGNLLSSTLMDYCMPTTLDSPDVEIFHRVTPSTDSLNGVKGVGESGTIVGYAAVMNALNDALSSARPGAQVNVAPATPDSIIAALGQPD
jgi:carbon-monoxide dehydrogenase large subunit